MQVRGGVGVCSLGTRQMLSNVLVGVNSFKSTYNVWCHPCKFSWNKSSNIAVVYRSCKDKQKKCCSCTQLFSPCTHHTVTYHVRLVRLNGCLAWINSYMVLAKKISWSCRKATIISLQSFIESKMWNLVQHSATKEMLPQESCFGSKTSCFRERISHNDVIMQKTWFS